MNYPPFLFVPAALPFFNVSNYIEAGLWMVVAVGFVVAATQRAGIIRKRCWLGAAAFFLFGVSDVVEVQTGAWYRPWWLLVWKGLCLLAIFYLLGMYIRERR
jgi:hypothetical protein